jgi:hypothetical protein
MPNENVITTAALIEKFKQALSDNWGYIWGTAGEMWTAAKQKELEKTTDSDRALSREYGSKWIGHYVADCSGLFSWAFKKLGGYMYHGSDTMYRKYCTDKGELSKGKRSDGGMLKPGTAVFVWNGKKYSHVGLYVGDGVVIEAMGTIKGVTTTKVTASKWTNWGELKGVDYSGIQPDPEPTPEPEKKPTIKRGSTGPYVVECQEDLICLGYDVGKTGADGKFGANTEKAVKAFQKDHDGPDGKALKVDGIVGQATWWALDEAMKPQPGPMPEKKYSVTIHNLDYTQAQAIANNYPGSEIKEETT